MRAYRKYNKEDIIKYAKEVYSIAGLLKALGLKPAGGSYSTIKKYLQLYDVDTSHWTGQGWNKEQRQKDWSEYTRNSFLKNNLINEKGHKCENCKNTKWNGKDIALELHHIDGDNTNNEYENLQLLCCNCHAQTPNWRRWTRKGKLKSKRKINRCNVCNTEVYKTSEKCKKCFLEDVKKNTAEKPTFRERHKKKCLDCEIQVDYRSKRCPQCEYKRRRK